MKEGGDGYLITLGWEKIMGTDFELSILLVMVDESKTMELNKELGNVCGVLDEITLGRNLGVFKKDTPATGNYNKLNDNIREYNRLIALANKGQLKANHDRLNQLIAAILTDLDALKSASVDDYAAPKGAGGGTQQALRGIQDQLKVAVDTIIQTVNEKSRDLGELTTDSTKLGNFEARRKYLCELQEEKKGATPYQITQKRAKKLGDLMIDALKLPDEHVVKKALLSKLADKTISRCLACSSVKLDGVPSDVAATIQTFREDYDLTFPSNVEYDSYFQEFLKNHTSGGAHNLELSKLPDQSKVHILLCDKNSKPDVINATEQYMRKLKNKGTIAGATPEIKLVSSHDELESVLSIADAKNMEVSFTNISHASSETMGYIDLAPDLKTAIITYANTQNSDNKIKLITCLRSNSMDGCIEFLDGLVAGEVESGRSSASVTLDNFRTFNPAVAEEPRELAELINKHASIRRVRMLGCTTAGPMEQSDTQGMVELTLPVGTHEPRFFGGRVEKKILVEFTDSSEKNSQAKKIAKVSQLVTRPGVIIKGECGVINPGEGGILRYDSDWKTSHKLYKQKSDDPKGKSVVVIKAPVYDTTKVETKAIFEALVFLRDPQNLKAENLDAAIGALQELRKIKPSDMPKGWKLQYVEALILELERRRQTITATATDKPSPP